MAKKRTNIRAKKSNTKSKKDKEKEEKRRKMWLLIGSLVVAVTMIASGLYMSNYGHYQRIQQQNHVDEFISSFEPKATDITFYVENFSDEFIFITNKGFDWGTLKYIKNNMSVKGVKKIEVDFVNKKYYVFRFKLNTTTDKNKVFDEIYNTFRFPLDIENKDTLLGVYNGYIYGIAKRVKILAPVSTHSGDFVTGTWYIMKTNTTTKDVALISGIVEQCNNMSAVVKNITTVNVEGMTDNGKILEKLEKHLNRTSMKNIKIENPKVKFNGNVVLLLKNLINTYPNNISTDNASNISTINFAEFRINVKNLDLNNTNNTNASNRIISFEYNSTKEEMEKILNNLTAAMNYTINYTIIPGKITFGIDANVWNEEIHKVLKENLKNLTIEKEGAVSIAGLCVNDKKLVSIRRNTNFNAVLNLNRKINDTIRVKVNLYTMTGGGETRYVPYLSVDLDLK